MKKTVKMAICAALIVSANLFATVNNTYAADPAVTAITAKQVSAEQFSSTINELKSLTEQLPNGATSAVQAHGGLVRGYINIYENASEDSMRQYAEGKIKQQSQLLKEAIQADTTTGTDYSSLLTAVDNTLDMWNGTVAGANIAARNAQNTATDAQTRVGALEGTVNDTTTGLAATNGIATDAQTRVGALEGTVNGTTGLTARVTALEGSLGTGGTGLASDVNGLKTTVGDENSGLVKKVNDHTTQITNHEGRIGTLETTTANHTTQLADHETRITANKNAIDAEEAARVNADNALSSRINNEEAARVNADNALSSRINNEEAARINADNALSSRINNEEAARVNADNALSSRINNEEAARIAADNAEAQIRAERDAILQSNIEAEVNARIAAINAEKNARMAQDEILQNNIDLEAATRFQADRLLQFNIDSEAEARRAGDAALDQKIMNETYARQREDRAIRDEMNAGFQRLDEKINNGVAMSLAVAGLKMPEYDPNHKLSGAIGFGHFHSANAFAVGVFYQFDRDVSINLSYARSGSEGGISAGVSFKF